MTRERHHSLFPMLLILFFLALNAAYYLFLPFRLDAVTLCYAWLLEFVAVGLAYEFTALVLSQLCSGSHLPSLDTLRTRPSVALLCVTCDDVDSTVLRKLASQTYTDLQIFILDDSQMQSSRAAIDRLPFIVLRRDSRAGYKAGNLNNWLMHYETSFSYFVVADADTVLPDTFVEEMLHYAEHPANQSVGLFESLIRPWNIENEFVRLQAVMLPFAHRRQLSVDDRFGLTFSVGHNNLYRTAMVREIGGFVEDYIAEDYATTVDFLKRRTWTCRTAPVHSLERAPANLAEYGARRARWAFSAFQLLSLKTDGLPLNARLKLLKTLHDYAAPLVGTFGILILIAVNICAALSSRFFSGVEPSVCATVLIFWLSYLFVPLCARTIVVGRCGIPFQQFMRSSFFMVPCQWQPLGR